MDFPLLAYRPRSLSWEDDLRRIARALDAASSLSRDFYSLTFKAECKPSGDPEWCVSIGLVETNRTVAGGICNPTQDEVFLGSIEDGSQNSSGCRTEPGEHAPVVLASRTEFLSGCWA